MASDVSAETTATSDEAPGPLVAQLVAEVATDPALTRLIERWPELPDELRKAVLRVAGIQEDT